MEEFVYDAFISYSHSDMQWAKKLQHRLETFSIPKDMTEATGGRKKLRVFRDQTDLTGAELEAALRKELDASKYLIVICSTSTKLSTWVPREIARFLEFHDRDHVLTVLVDGEPNEVIPQILLEETLVETDENGTEQTYTKIYEPLSCDYRGSLRQARKTEIPRLAAALLGCSYDELVMRARQYKLRRLTAFAAAGFAEESSSGAGSAPTSTLPGIFSFWPMRTVSFVILFSLFIEAIVTLKRLEIFER